MTPASKTLTTVLQVLDRADLKQAQHEAMDRDHLVTLAQSLGSNHSIAVLNEATEEVLSECAASPGERSAAPEEGFGWDRPANEAQRQRQIAHFQRRSSRCRTVRRWSGIPWVALLIAVTYGFHTLLMAAASPHSAIGSSPGVAWIFSTLLMAFPFGILLGLAHTLINPSRDDAEVQALTSFDADLPAPLETYLARPACRAYLRQVLASGVPELLVQDAQRLEELRWQAVEADQIKANRARQAKEEAAARAQAALRPQRMARIAAALRSEDPRPIATPAGS